MPATGRFYGSMIGADCGIAHTLIANAGPNTFAMAALNTGCHFRFTAPDTRDILTVYVNWATVTAAGVVELRIETIDATTGKPSGSLYDANATKSQAPVAGWQAFTFASPPTTGLTAGTEFAIVLLTTTGGTTHTLNRSIDAVLNSAYPTIAQTAADGTTRSNFADVSGSVPICTVIYDDSVEEVPGFTQFAGVTSYNVFGTAASGLKFVVPSGQTWTVRAVKAPTMNRVGTPAGNLRCRILNSSDAQVSGATSTADKDSMTGSNSKRSQFVFQGIVTLAAGTYRVVFDSASSADSSNCWRIRSLNARASGLVPASLIQTSTADITAGTISWTDTATEQSQVQLVLDDITVAAADYPSANDVRSGVSFNSGGSTGNMTLPAITDVASGVQYGTNGTELTGTLAGGAAGMLYRTGGG